VPFTEYVATQTPHLVVRAFKFLLALVGRIR